jgi:Spy/CpxP family protein refolding chaperone
MKRYLFLCFVFFALDCSAQTKPNHVKPVKTNPGDGQAPLRTDGQDSTNNEQQLLSDIAAAYDQLEFAIEKEYDKLMKEVKDDKDSIAHKIKSMEDEVALLKKEMAEMDKQIKNLQLEEQKTLADIFKSKQRANKTVLDLIMANHTKEAGEYPGLVKINTSLALKDSLNTIRRRYPIGH